MVHIARVIGGGLAALALAGCAAHHPKVPSYDDQELRPINQDLVAWLKRMNADQDQAKPAQPAATAQVAKRDTSTDSNAALVSVVGTGGKTLSPGATNSPPKSPPGSANQGTPPTPQPATAAASAHSGAAYRCSSPLPAETLAPPGASSAWRVPAGTTFCQALWVFAGRANWQVLWEVPGDGPSLPELAVTGDFNQALRALMRVSKPAGQPFPLHVEQWTRDSIIRVTVPTNQVTKD